jgi:hypothetical protein
MPSTLKMLGRRGSSSTCRTKPPSGSIEASGSATDRLRGSGECAAAGCSGCAVGVVVRDQLADDIWLKYPRTSPGTGATACSPRSTRFGAAASPVQRSRRRPTRPAPPASSGRGLRQAWRLQRFADHAAQPRHHRRATDHDNPRQGAGFAARPAVGDRPRSSAATSGAVSCSSFAAVRVSVDRWCGRRAR